MSNPKKTEDCKYLTMEEFKQRIYESFDDVSHRGKTIVIRHTPSKPVGYPHPNIPPEDYVLKLKNTECEDSPPPQPDKKVPGAEDEL